MRKIYVRDNADDKEVAFVYGDYDKLVKKFSPSSIIIKAVGYSIEVTKSEIDYLIKALQMAKKEYFND